MRNGKRELLIGGVGLVKGTIKNAGKAMINVCEEFEPEFERIRFLEKAPFTSVSLIIRYGMRWGAPEVGKINHRHSELEVAIEAPMAELRMLDESKLTGVVKKLTLIALVAIAMEYNLDQIHWKGLLQLTETE